MVSPECALAAIENASLYNLNFPAEESKYSPSMGMDLKPGSRAKPKREVPFGRNSGPKALLKHREITEPG